MTRKIGAWLILMMLVVVLALVALRVAAPHLIRSYLNETLAQHEVYNGEVQDVDLSVMAGRVTLGDLNLTLVADGNEYPFFHVQEIEGTVSWSDLLRGDLVAEIVMRSPAVQIYPQLFRVWPEPEPQVDDVPFDETLRALPPIFIERYAIESGEVVFTLQTDEGEASAHLRELYLEATNLSTRDQVESLPSDLTVVGNLMEGGRLDIDGQIEILQRIPLFDLNVEINDVSLTSFNPFLKLYPPPLDFSEGQLNIHSELVYLGENLNGYIRPVVEDVEIIDWEDGLPELAKILTEGGAAAATRILENQEQDQVATNIPLAGKLTDPEADGLEAVWALLRNAFVEAIPDQFAADFEMQAEGESQDSDENR